MATWEFHHRAGKGVLALSGSWLARGGEARIPELDRLCVRAAVQRLSFDVSKLGPWDTLLVAFLWDVKRAAAAAGVALDDTALPQSAKQLLRLLPSRPAQPDPARQRAAPLLARLGAAAIDFLAEAGANVTLAAAVAVGGGRLLLGRARVRAADFVTYLLDAGPRALGVVGVVNFLIGAVLAYIGAAQLRPFGAEDYVPSLTAVASGRRLPPAYGRSYDTHPACCRGSFRTLRRRACRVHHRRLWSDRSVSA